ncbi:LysR family transcriptional regulator [Rheinheimera sp. UJ51]|uniref:LysR family transcriptional regulator n=1 Tax=unclassified Rheinheimera TaxID=115860 RepID=UPI001E37C680|nr:MULTISPECIES: LysR family transcriptional regulator [unclassified Rheinheimera]MCC5453290.1 LysR family transcriptional regulator [Rheinheimera sp. UJ51]MCF4010936.1 LysR family transcriptional regulator [Rheinheimera sp. UJ63]
MQANDLILFAQVVELGSFSKAAEQNNLTNSVVSKRITRLEESLNTQLLYRTTRTLSLTEAGKTLLGRAIIIRDTTQEALNEVSDKNGSLTGHIKMSVPTISGDLLLAETIVGFCAQHPKLTIDMSMENRFVNPVEEGVDLVIRTGQLEDSSLKARHIIDSQWVVCASHNYLLRFGKPSQPQALNQHNCLTYTHPASMGNNWQFKNEKEQITVKVSGSFSSDNAAALRKAALCGHGVVYVPKCLVHDDIQNGSLITLFGAPITRNIGVYAIHPYVKKVPKKISELIDCIKAAYQHKASYFNIM